MNEQIKWLDQEISTGKYTHGYSRRTNSYSAQCRTICLFYRLPGVWSIRRCTPRQVRLFLPLHWWSNPSRKHRKLRSASSLPTPAEDSHFHISHRHHLPSRHHSLRTCLDRILLRPESMDMILVYNLRCTCSLDIALDSLPDKRRTFHRIFR